MASALGIHFRAKTVQVQQKIDETESKVTGAIISLDKGPKSLPKEDYFL